MWPDLASGLAMWLMALLLWSALAAICLVAGMMHLARSLLIGATLALLVVVGLLVNELVNRGGSGPDGGSALVGGPFTLVDQDGQTVTDRDFRGRWMLVYFGYTFCPDVCPTELQVMADALDRLGEQAGKVQPVFVTVDPARDTPEVLKDYTANFGHGMVGLTGSPDQVSEAAKAYRVYFRKAEVEGSSGYLMDHSSVIYLMDPKGQFATHFPHGSTPEAVVEELRKRI